jgi:hypothetical protein
MVAQNSFFLTNILYKCITAKITIRKEVTTISSLLNLKAAGSIKYLNSTTVSPPRRRH